MCEDVIALWHPNPHFNVMLGEMAIIWGDRRSIIPVAAKRPSAAFGGFFFW